MTYNEVLSPQWAEEHSRNAFGRSCDLLLFNTDKLIQEDPLHACQIEVVNNTLDIFSIAYTKYLRICIKDGCARIETHSPLAVFHLCMLRSAISQALKAGNRLHLTLLTAHKRFEVDI
jgi:hypothetical protein